MSLNYTLSVALGCAICGSIAYVMRIKEKNKISSDNQTPLLRRCIKYLDIVGLSMLAKEIVFRYLVMFNTKIHFMLLVAIGAYFTFISKKIVEEYRFSVYNSVIYIYVVLYALSRYLCVSALAYTALFAYSFLLSYFSFILLRIYNERVLCENCDKTGLITLKLMFIITNFALYTIVYILSIYYISVCISAFVAVLASHIVYSLYKGHKAFNVPFNDIVNMLKDIVFVSLFFTVNITADTANIFTESYSYMVYIMSSVSAVINKFMMTALCLDVQHDRVRDNVARATFVTTVHAVLCATMFMYYNVIGALPMSLILSAAVGSLIYTYTKVYCMYTQHYAHMVHAYNAFLFVAFMSVLTLVRFLLQVNIISSVSLYTVCWTWNVTYLLNLLITYSYVQYLKCARAYRQGMHCIVDSIIIGNIYDGESNDILLYEI